MKELLFVWFLYWKLEIAFHFEQTAAVINCECFGTDEHVTYTVPVYGIHSCLQIRQEFLKLIIIWQIFH